MAHDDTQLSDMDKLSHLLSHWQEHNNDHATNYRSWADKAEEAGLGEAADLLRQAAEATDKITDLFVRALAAID